MEEDWIRVLLGHNFEDKVNERDSRCLNTVWSNTHHFVLLNVKTATSGVSASAAAAAAAAKVVPAVLLPQPKMFFRRHAGKHHSLLLSFLTLCESHVFALHMPHCWQNLMFP